MMLVEDGVPKKHWIWEGGCSGGATGRRNMQVQIVSSPVKETVAKETNQSHDVGPVTRQSLTRADDVFGGLFNLTL